MIDVVLILIAIWIVIVLTAWAAAMAAVAAFETLMQAPRRPSPAPASRHGQPRA
jgi:hypothetical protein